ncbi:uncharacterized protein LOC110042126 isoform X3 [Orbicella faveolata]|uniref:uncharacterized protein LOC110042126 isoform X3 n=1 Tax=Orbicella faveolata TaxID=48498 RepID=UPI0009E415AC|nr:uncharacterized protein LOC110042126 isoform X3 [Orbicella faveolata]
MSQFAFDPELEQQLNDIDEFIRAQCGDDLSVGFNQSEWLLPSQTGEAPAQTMSSSWNVRADQSFPSSCGAKMEGLSKDPPPKDLQPEVGVQIMNLMDTYDKRTKKLSGKYEYRLGSSEVTIVARASDEIKRVRVYVQRCPEAAVRTQDTVGVVTIVKSKPFRITTRASHKTRSPELPLEKSSVAGNDIQRIPSQHCEVQNHSFKGSNFTEVDEIAIAESLNSNAVVNRVASKLRQELSKLHLNDENPSSTPTCLKTNPLVFGKVVLRPDTKLDKRKVSMHYNRDVRARYVVEQPDLPDLLKLMSRRTTCTSGGRRRANGFKTAEEDFWWACGLCFFERRKKSTVKAHVTQRVCQKTSLRKEMRQRRKALGHLKRYASCEFSTEGFEDIEPLAWNSPLSV